MSDQAVADCLGPAERSPASVTRLCAWVLLLLAMVVQPAGYPGIFAATVVSSATTSGAETTDRPLIAVLPEPIAQAVRAGTNRQNLAPYLNAALSGGGAFDLGGYTYRIAGRLMPGSGTHLTGAGIFLADPAFNDRAGADGLQMMLRIADGLQVGKGIVFDGNSISRPGFWITGARNTQGVADVVLNATFRNLSFDGIDVSRNNGAWRNRNIRIGATVKNVGWIGVNLEGIEGLIHDGIHVSRTGFHGIYVGFSDYVRGDGFKVDKSHPPYRVYDGPGGFAGKEKGFLFGHFSTSHARWTHFFLFDNRHAGYDGFGIGEDGPLGEAESSDIVAQGEIWYAGLFGFDVSSNMTADIKVYYPTRQGVQFGLDLGGTLSNITVKALVERNLHDESARFSATGTVPRKVSMIAGSPVMTIVGGGDFTVVPGQTASGPGIPTGAKVVAVEGSRIKLNLPAKRTSPNGAPISAIFRASITFENCVLDLRVNHTRYGVGVQSDADSFARYSNVRVTGDLSMANDASVRRLNGRLPLGMTISAKLNPVRASQ